MLIRSMAGDFEIAIEKFEVEGHHFVMVGKMGVWEARTYITAREVVAVIGKLFCVAVLLYGLKLPYLLLQSGANNETTEDNLNDR